MKRVRKFFYLFPAALFTLLCLSSTYAQVTTGSVRGVVLDPNGAVVTNAKVTLTKKSTNNSLTTQTSGTGSLSSTICWLATTTSLPWKHQTSKLLPG